MSAVMDLSDRGELKHRRGVRIYHVVSHLRCKVAHRSLSGGRASVEVEVGGTCLLWVDLSVHMMLCGLGCSLRSVIRWWWSSRGGSRSGVRRSIILGRLHATEENQLLPIAQGVTHVKVFFHEDWVGSVAQNGI